MGWDSLARSIVELDSFQREYKELLVDSVVSQFPTLVPANRRAPSQHDWQHLLFCASIFARSDNMRCEDAALRVAQTCLSSDDTATGLKDAACLVLDSLTNRQAIKLAEERGLVPPQYDRRMPLPLRIDVTRRDIEYSHYSISEEKLLLNRFQKAFWGQATRLDWFSVSAPTSTGKSFAICNWLGEHLHRTTATIAVYIVPTRALIHQVEIDIKQHFQSVGLRRVSVSSMPVRDAIKPDMHNVFVLTQERMHLLLNVMPRALAIDVLLVDEAQKIGDGARGILLEQVIATVVERSPDVKVIFASPQTSNPEILLSLDDNNRRKDSLRSTFVTVNQNLLWASQVPHKPREWKLELCVKDNTRDLGTIRLPFRANPDSKRLPFLAFALSGQSPGTLLYVNRASDAEKAAIHLWELAGEDASVVANPKVANLIELVTKTIHKRYCLAKALERGIAFHYGNMPLLVREEIERLFMAGTIRFLVCTSTLLEGVNLPCRTIYVRGPRKGVRTPMHAADFWNLAGRAGRLGKEFQGTIVCVDPRRRDVWKEPPPRSKTAYPIRRASGEVLKDTHGFLSFVSAGTPRDEAAKHPDREQLYAFLSLELRRNGSLLQSPVVADVGPADTKALEDAVASSLENVTVPTELMERNPGISPVAMQSLVEYFAEYIEEGKKRVEELLPPLPESDGAVEIYNRILSRINTHLASVFSRQTYRFAILIVNWLRGHSLQRMILSDIKWHGQKKRDYKLPSLIRDTMRNIEEIARFLAPKYTSCYIDLLRWQLESHGLESLAKEIPELHVWLEFGASQKTQLSLMALGMTRTSAASLMELIVDDSLDEDAAVEWIRNQDLESSELPRSVIAEVTRVVDMKQTN